MIFRSCWDFRKRRLPNVKPNATARTKIARCRIRVYRVPTKALDRPILTVTPGNPPKMEKLIFPAAYRNMFSCLIVRRTGVFSNPLSCRWRLSLLKYRLHSEICGLATGNVDTLKSVQNLQRAFSGWPRRKNISTFTIRFGRTAH